MQWRRRIMRRPDWPSNGFSDIDPRAWLADVLTRLPGHPAKRIEELLPWNLQNRQPLSAAA
jgi:transposase